VSADCYEVYRHPPHGGEVFILGLGREKEAARSIVADENLQVPTGRHRQPADGYSDSPIMIPPPLSSKCINIIECTTMQKKILRVCFLFSTLLCGAEKNREKVCDGCCV
jgi:hypothetical protein